jgi:hypothetical protein
MMEAYQGNDFPQINPCFGTLRELPFELHNMIWMHVGASTGPFVAEEDIERDLGIMETSRALHEEFTISLYGGVVLTFSIIPGSDPSKFDIPVQDQYGNSDKLLWR